MAPVWKAPRDPLCNVDIGVSERTVVRERQEDEAGEPYAERDKEEAGQAPWQRLNFLPEPHQQGSFRPMSRCSLTACG